LDGDGCIFAAGILIVDDYGISWDEPTQHQHTIINLAKIYKTFNWELPQQYLDKYRSLPDLDEYDHRFYGVAVQFIPALGEILTQFDLPSAYVYYLCHLFTFLLFFYSCGKFILFSSSALAA